MKKNTLLLLSLCFAGKVFAQDAHFTQFENSPFFINPASAGMVEQSDYRGSLITRNQWHKLVRPTNSTMISADVPLLRYQGGERSRSNLGLGLYYGFSTMGDNKTRQTQMGIAVSGITTVGEHKYLSLGISAGKGGFRNDLSAATWDNQYDGFQYDASLPSNEAYNGILKARYFDLNAGLNFLSLSRKNGASTNIGASVAHLTSPKLKNDPLLNGNIDPRITAYFRSEIDLKIKNAHPIFLIPRGMFAMQGVHMEIQAGASLFVSTQPTSQVTSFKHKTGIEGGVMYRYNDALGLLAAYKNENLRIGLCYDLSVSVYGEALKRRGGAELSLIYYGINKSLRDRKPIYE